MADALLAALLVSCSSQPGDTPVSPAVTADTAIPVPPIAVDLESILVLTRPGGGLLQSHATVAWGGDRVLVAFVVGSEPATRAVAQVFLPDGTPVGASLVLSPPGTTGDKPDVEWDGDAQFRVGWTDGRGRVFLATVDTDGVLAGADVLYEGTLHTDAVDLAVQPGGAGIAIWTEFETDVPEGGDTGGRIVWRGFDPTRAGVGLPRLADESSRKTSDAAPLPDGGWVGVWAREYDHPARDGEVVYEVWGRLYRGDGTAWTFRADDLDTAWPSRPAVAARPDGLLAVSWRDKLEADGAGLGSGAYGRLFAADATPLGPSVALGPGHDGDRVVVDWAGELAVYVWQETDPDGLPGVILSAVDAGTGEIVVDRISLHETGGARDERPSVAIRSVDAGWEALVVWESIGIDGTGDGIRARTVTLSR